MATVDQDPTQDPGDQAATEDLGDQEDREDREDQEALVDLVGLMDQVDREAPVDSAYRTDLVDREVPEDMVVSVDQEAQEDQAVLEDQEVNMEAEEASPAMDSGATMDLDSITIRLDLMDLDPPDTFIKLDPMEELEVSGDDSFNIIDVNLICIS